jgi:hypothetical protein
MNQIFRNAFEKVASWTHAAEIGGLGLLAAPTAKKVMTGKDMSEGKQHAAELGGLGILAAPSAYALGKKYLGKVVK